MNTKRQLDVQDRLSELYDILNDWEVHEISATDPGMAHKAKLEINRINKLIDAYEQELSGGPKVIEDPLHPIHAPIIKRINRQWVIGIVMTLITASMGTIIYRQVYKINPDYHAYIVFMEKGDKAIEEDNFGIARASYEKALAYFPGDSAALRKLDLLDEADILIENTNYRAATEIFDLVVRIGISPQEDFEALHGDIIQLNISWMDEGRTLIIQISGGVPFNDAFAPYELLGIDYCETCLQWEESKDGFTLKISQVDQGVQLNIGIRDSQGQRASQAYSTPNKSTQSGSPKTETVPPPSQGEASESVSNSVGKKGEEKDNLYQDSKNLADQFFQNKEYIKAKEKYVEALSYTLNIKERQYCEAKIQGCNSLLVAGKEQRAKQAILAKLVRIPEGSFIMGDADGFASESPHTVRLNGFRIAKTEVTKAEFQEFCAYTGYNMPEQPSWTSPNHPISNITWRDAQAFCKWLSVRLPTEAEWEYAAKGGGENKYSGGNSLGQIAIYKNNSTTSKPVQSKQGNGYGLFDMTGNVAEWCQDWYGKNYYTGGDTLNPKGPDSGPGKVVRGGSYKNIMSTEDDPLRIGARNYEKANVRKENIGFRIATH